MSRGDSRRLITAAATSKIFNSLSSVAGICKYETLSKVPHTWPLGADFYKRADISAKVEKKARARRQTEKRQRKLARKCQKPAQLDRWPICRPVRLLEFCRVQQSFPIHIESGILPHRPHKVLRSNARFYH